MKVKSVVRALEKAGYKVHRKERRVMDFRTNKPFMDVSYYAENEKYICTFHPCYENERAECVNIKSHGEERDLMTDYFPGFYPRTIKHLIESMER